MSKLYNCDICGKESVNEEDIPKYKMFVCDSYDGEDVMMCVDCENKIKNQWRK